MPVYLYRREDGTTFEYKQKFLDDPLTVDPDTGQKVVRVVQPTGIIFKGSGFYVNDSKSASKNNLSTPPSNSKEADAGSSSADSGSADSGKKDSTEAKAEKPAEKKSETTAKKSADKAAS